MICYYFKIFTNGSSDDDTLITFFGNKFFSKLRELYYLSLKINDDILYTYVMGKTESFKKLEI